MLEDIKISNKQVYLIWFERCNFYKKKKIVVNYNETTTYN